MLQQSTQPDAASVPGQADETDGRRLRSLASRQKIIEAMLELVRTGDLKPSAEAVAAKAGVGRRTVFRIFTDMESIFLEIQQMFRRNIAPLRDIPLEGDTLEARLLSLIQRRVMLFEQIMWVTASAKLYRYDSKALQQGHVGLQRELRSHMLGILSEEAQNDIGLVEALDACLSLDLWQRLRFEQKLDVQTAKAVCERLALGACHTYTS